MSGYAMMRKPKSTVPPALGSPVTNPYPVQRASKWNFSGPTLIKPADIPSPDSALWNFEKLETSTDRTNRNRKDLLTTDLTWKQVYRASQAEIEEAVKQAPAIRIAQNYDYYMFPDGRIWCFEMTTDGISIYPNVGKYIDTGLTESDINEYL